jgi:anti-sigma regulatory factor (Ser/Thr protein kinase)
MEISLELRLPRDAASVPLVRHLCGDALRKLRVAEDCVGDVELAITEACTNVVKHSSGAHDEYKVKIAIGGKTCEISVSDAGVGFDHEMLGRDPAPISAESGRGIILMRALVDKVKFVSRPRDGTIVHLVKTLKLLEEPIPGLATG